MISLAWPWVLLLLPLPWVLRRVLAPAPRPALRVPRVPEQPEAATLTSRLRLSLAVLAWLLLVVAAARPQSPDDTLRRPVTGRDLMLAVDLSASMATRDLTYRGALLDRLGAARVLAGEFVKRRAGDRVGLVVFGSRAYVHTPLTFDLPAVGAAVAAAEIGLAGRETALGDAIALATRHLRELPGSARVLVLLTDGVNTAGTLAPSRAAWLAQREGVRIYAVGIGGSATADPALSAGLREVAELTGGRHAVVTDGAGLEAFFRLVDGLEPTARPDSGERMARELYPWPLAAALLLAAWLARRRGEGGHA